MSTDNLPIFSTIKPETIVPEVKNFIAHSRQLIHRLTENPNPSWATLMQALEDNSALEAKLWQPIEHLNAVMSRPELREAYDEALALWSEFHTEISHDTALFAVIKHLHDSPEFKTLTRPQQTVIKHQLRDFHLSGVDLPADKKARYRKIVEELTVLSSKVGANTLDANKAFIRPVHDVQELAGLPDWLIEEAALKAKELGQEGHAFSLEAPVYSAIMQFADHRPLREDLYVAYVTRASELGPFPHQWDNGPLIDQILGLRQELAVLLGFKNYADLSLADKMAPSNEEVVAFLSQLAKASKPLAEKEMAALAAFAKTAGLHSTLQPWDLAYYREKLQAKEYAYSSEELRPYFPLSKVLHGLFELLSQLFQVQFTEEDHFDHWHKDALLYRINNPDGSLQAHLYLDLFARPGKQQGAWVGGCYPRYRDKEGKLHHPVTFLVCNFSRPGIDRPALLTHSEMQTLFHEFGHALHYSLTEIDEPSASGTSGVAWDAVEFPSQLMENWTWSKEVLNRLSGHYQTQEPLPEALYEKLLASKDFHCAMQMVRQLEFALFDFRIHSEFDVHRPHCVQNILDEVRKEVSVVPIPNYHRFQNAFTHIFDGGYAAGYYSYKWAEVLSADAFSRFEKEGLLNSELGLEFKHKILTQGGSEDAMDLFVSFMGRKPEIQALLISNGIKAE